MTFDEVYRSRGGKWARDSETNVLQSRFLSYVESMPAAMVGAAESVLREQPERTRPTLPRMHFGLIDGRSFNCYATRSDQDYFVGISASVPFALLECAALFFAQAGFYPGIGNPEDGPLVALDGVEALPLFQLAQNRFAPRIREGLTDREGSMLALGIDAVRVHTRQDDPQSGTILTASQYFRQVDTLLDMLMPSCVIRREHCQYLAAVVAHFFWFHEIAHVTQGHLRSLQEGRERSLTLCEFAEDDETPETGGPAVRLGDVTTLAMEFDADAEAIMMTIGIIMLDIDIENDDFPYVDKYERIGLFVLYLVIVFQIVANEEARTKPKKNTHPPAGMRLMNMLVHLMSITSKDERVTDAIAVGLQSARQLAMAPHYSFLTGILNGEDSYRNEWFAVNRHRHNLKNAYDTYRYGNLRPLVASFLADLDIRDKMKFGPDPDWWGPDV